MRYIAFLLLVLMLLCVAFLFGCSDTSWCTDSFCLVPRETVDDPNVIEIDESKVLALIGNQDSETTETVIPPTPTTPNTLADIVSDVAAGNTTYLDQTVTVDGYVTYKDKKGDAMVIHTKPDAKDATAQGAVFWVEDFGNPDRFNQYAIGSQYEFTVMIYLIKEPEGTVKWRSIWSKFPE